MYMSPEEEQELAKLLKKGKKANAAAAAKDDSMALDYSDLETLAGDDGDDDSDDSDDELLEPLADRSHPNLSTRVANRGVCIR